jgi:regulator of sigma E protease
MNIIIFIIVLAVLVLVHEFGHFIVAKKSGIKVTEFGLGFPPKLWSKTYGETEYSINAIPFGGFVRIFGEDPNDESLSGPERTRAISSKPRYIQAAVLVAGVFFNMLFAWLLISTGYLVGLPSSTDHVGPGTVENVRLTVTSVSPDSPASKSNLKAGDQIISVASESAKKDYLIKEVTASNVSNFIEAHGKEGVVFELSRAGKSVTTEPIIGVEGIIPGKVAVGIGMDTIGTLRLPFFTAFYQGAKDVGNLFVATASGLFDLISKAFVGKANLSEVTGPVGIVGLVGEVTKLGFVYLMSFTALISINLAVINLLPFPALDGGRLVIVAIEAIIRRPISPKITNILNGAGFAVLILLMLVVTIHDIMKLL